MGNLGKEEPVGNEKTGRRDSNVAEIGFIGLGNMAKAIIGGMLQKEIVQPDQIIGNAKTAATKEKMAADYGIGIRESNAAVAAEVRTLILAVKPQFLGAVIDEIRDVVTEDQLIISIAAGKSLAWLSERFGKALKLICCMPNTPALVGEGCTGVCVNDRVSEAETAYCLRLMESFGRATLVEERLISAVSLVSGSSPAYVFMFIEALADGAVMAGMPRKQAYKFAAQAVLGSAKLMLETGMHPGELKDMVCSPGGTTIEGVKVLETYGFRGAVMDAMAASLDKYNTME